MEGRLGMTLQLGALRDALLDAGASPEKANKAAEEAAGFVMGFGAAGGALAELSARVDQCFAQVDVRFAQVENSFGVVNGRIDTLQWMLGVVLAASGAVLAGVCVVLARMFVPH
jgi:hypothetical protein